MFQTPKTIKEILEEINTKYFLPAIQREFVWTEDQIISLFDSLLKGFPIGSFLFWKVNRENLQKFEFYKFIQHYDVDNNYHNPIADNVKEKNEIISILDGQQRITSLYIGLKGSYIKKNKTKKLYISLSSKFNMEEVDDIENMYKLKFMTDDEYQNNNDEYWFLVGDIINMSLSDITNYSIEKKLSSLGIETLSKLYDLANSRVINYFLETSDDIDKVLNIFVRINSGGTHLSYSDLLLSVATANWKNTNAREEINDLLNEINKIAEGFNATKDFILKSALYLINREMKFKVANFTAEAMHDIENNWQNIKQSLKVAFMFLSQNGFYHKNMISNYPATIIALYIYKYGKDKLLENKNEIIKFVRISMLKGLFSSNLDGVLSNIRKYIKDKEVFKVKDIDKIMPFSKKLSFSNQDLKDLTLIKDTQKSFILILSILYDRKKSDTPNVLFSKNTQINFKNIPSEKFVKMVLNYQLVSNNESGKPFFDRDDYKDKLIDNFFDLENFDINKIEMMFENRQKNIVSHLREKLKV